MPPMLKTFALLALALAALVMSHELDTSEELRAGPDGLLPIVEEPDELTADEDGHIPIREEPAEFRQANIDDYTDYNTTSGITFADINNRKLQAGAAVVAGLQIASAAAPIIADIIKGTRKECQQCACWIATDSRTCGLSVAEKVQAEVMMGRDRFTYEKIEDHGMWVRYWRTKFEPTDRGDIATGNCTNGEAFAVTNCMTTGRVHC